MRRCVSLWRGEAVSSRCSRAFDIVANPLSDVSPWVMTGSYSQTAGARAQSLCNIKEGPKTRQASAEEREEGISVRGFSK